MPIPPSSTAASRPKLDSRHMSYLNVARDQRRPQADSKGIHQQRQAPGPLPTATSRRRAHTTPTRIPPGPLVSFLPAAPSPDAGAIVTPGSVPTPKPTLLDKLLDEGGIDLDAYGITEYRDGFFDALFFREDEVKRLRLVDEVEHATPSSFENRHPLSIRYFLPRQWESLKGVMEKVTSTHTGLSLAKASTATLIAYILCLIPSVNAWLGRYNFFMVVSTIINHPSRTIGAQIEGAILASIGAAMGLGWGAFGLWVSTSTITARVGYEGVLAVFLAIFMGIIAAIRSSYIRLYQLVLCAGIAATYACLAEVTRKQVEWSKFYAHGVPWIIGQAISLVVCVLFFPDAGARPLAVSIHSAFEVILNGLAVPTFGSGHYRGSPLRRDLARIFVDLAEAYRDLAIEISITRFNPRDIKELSGLLQDVVRALLWFKPESVVFATAAASSRGTVLAPLITTSDAEANDGPVARAHNSMTYSTCKLILSMRDCISSCDAVIMDMSGYRRHTESPSNVSTDLPSHLDSLKSAISAFDAAEKGLLEGNHLPLTLSDTPEVLKLFSICKPVRYAAYHVEKLASKVIQMSRSRHKHLRIYLPSYPFLESLNRTNAQVRHDRGGVTAGSYYRSFGEIAGVIKTMKARDIAAKSPEDDHFCAANHIQTRLDDIDNPAISSGSKSLRYKLWVVLHRLQGFETRYALKVILLTSVLSIPAWIKDDDRIWWNDYQCWWVVAMAWIMMHPRIGGNFQDLAARVVFAIAGSFWGTLAYVTGHGSPYVMAVFAAVYLIPMLYRFTQSSHPRSGLVGCLSFTVVYIRAFNIGCSPPPGIVGVNTGLAIVIGITAAMIVNWVLWPFIARHESRKAISTMMFYMSIMYRSIVAKYVYCEKGEEPSEFDIKRSELLEGRLREGFVRIRQLLGLARHEIRLRSTFAPAPYLALVASCERFFELVVTVRLSSLDYRPYDGLGEIEKATAKLLSYRRDAAATILSNLYIFSGALRSGNRVPSG